MNRPLRYRHIHLDFHTSEEIPDVGSRFDPERFAAVLSDARVDSITLFARGHHGWCYYPTKVGKAHPNLARPDLLGEMVEACRSVDIEVSIYHTVQWDELTAREHPEWRVMSPYNSAVWPDSTDPSAMNQLTATWHPICLNNPGYLDYLEALCEEVIRRYEPGGIFFDILLPYECVCPRCLASMQEAGRDPSKAEDRRLNDRRVLMEYYRRSSEAVWKMDPSVRLFHNSGHVYKGDRERYRHFSHLEIESLPTGGWGYDHFPVSALYAGTLGMEYSGMTGRFHTMWGEFGGYKRPVALEYECMLMAALGARCSIGDQMHPAGFLEEEAYHAVRRGYRAVEAAEEYLRDARQVADVAILSVESTNPPNAGSFNRDNISDDGAARLLLELHIPFVVIDSEADFSRFRLLILPDEVHVSGEMAERLNKYIQAGGKLLLTGGSGMNREETEFLIDLGLEYSGEMGAFSPDYIRPVSGLDRDLPKAPFVVYERPYKVRKGGGESWAESYEPYFNRRWDHFCSHQHTPYKPEPSKELDPVVTFPWGAYVCHPVFRAYHKSGQPLLKYLIRGILTKVYPEPLVLSNLPSSARITVTEQENHNRWIVHFLFAPPQLRGKGLKHPKGHDLALEIIEDPVPLRDVHCSVRSQRAPTRVYLPEEGEKLPFQFSGGRVEFTVPEVTVHQMVVIER
jgi:hypothetical protein